MNRTLLCTVVVGVLLLAPIAESRVGNGRSFGSRGSRGFSSPSKSFGGSPNRSYQSPYSAQPMQRPYSVPPQSTQTPQVRPPSVWKSLGAGLAGGFLGSMLFRSLGGGGYGNYLGGGMGGGGFGILEALLLGGLLFFVIRFILSRTQPSPSLSSSEGAAELMRQARPQGWSDPSPRMDESYGSALEITPIDTDLAMDFFFKIQGAWASRDLTPVGNLLDFEVKNYLDQEITKLKSARQMNRLENIAVRSVDVVESWKEGFQEYSTVRLVANLLDFTVDETTQQVVDGSRNTPVKFEEYWTFTRRPDSSSWKLSAIQQS